MQLGIFAKTYQRDSLDAILDAVVADGFSVVQFNMACAGLESMPAEIDDQLVETIRTQIDAHQLRICALSATFNLIHPDPEERSQGIERFHLLASKARQMGTDLLTLCTGTRDPKSKWRFHPENASPDAWSDLLFSLEQCVTVADQYNLRLGIEPEINNVIDSPQKARTLLDEMQSPRLVIIMDPANFFRYQDLGNMDAVLKSAFALLQADIALAHGKDICPSEPPTFCAAGQGVLNYHLYIDLLRQMHYQGPIVLHSLSDQQVPASARHVKSFLDPSR